MASIPKLAMPGAVPPAQRTPERAVPVSARSRIATAGRVSALAKVYVPRPYGAKRLRAEEPKSDSESEEEVPPPKPRLAALREDGRLLSNRSSELSHRSLELSSRSPMQSEAPTEISQSPKVGRCVGAAALGAMAGSSAGAVLGFLSGLVPAPLTLGLSVPINTGLGSVGGLVVGSAGGLLGQSLEAVEVEVREPGISLKLNHLQEPVRCALKGGLAMGSLGGAGGSAIGGMAGAAVGLPTAILTFGLSVPVCAALGSGMGFCIGSLAGGGVGMLGGSLRHLNSRAPAKAARA